MRATAVGPRPLPARANLEHLKKQAKSRLKVMRETMPQATLSAAQRTVAREYGFSSWRALKAWADAVHDEGERLVQAVRAGDLPVIRAVLARYPALVNCTTDRHERIAPSDTRAMRLIHVAVAEDQLEVARLLVNRGADLNVRNADGRLPLHDCFELGRDAIRDLLLDAGAELDAAAAAGWGMLHHLGALLARDGRSANDLTTGESPLGWCADGDQPEAARLLLTHGAIVTTAPFDWYAWRPTAMVSATRVAMVLLEYGADPNCQGPDEETPLHAVIRSRIVLDPTALVELLLEHGANPTQRNQAGHTSLDVATEQANSVAETYFPVRQTARKRLDVVIRRLIQYSERRREAR